MIRHILFWNYTEQVKNAHSEEETLTFLQKSVETMNGNIDGLIHAEIGKNIADGYDLVFYAEFESKDFSLMSTSLSIDFVAIVSSLSLFVFYLLLHKILGEQIL